MQRVDFAEVATGELRDRSAAFAADPQLV